MDSKMIWNGELVNDAQVSVQHRGMRYGDGAFESILMGPQQQIPLLQSHVDRMEEAAQVFRVHLPIDILGLQEALSALYHAQGQKGWVYARFYWWRKGAGAYAGQSDAVDWCLTMMPYQLPDKQLVIKELGKYTEQYKMPGLHAGFKTASSALYVQAGMFAQERGFDEVLILNHMGRPIETSSCNLWLVKDGEVLTPMPQEGPVIGAYRRFLLQRFKALAIPVYECVVDEEQLLAADELFLSNAIKGVQPVQQYKSKIYSSELAQRLYADWQRVLDFE